MRQIMANPDKTQTDRHNRAEQAEGLERARVRAAAAEREIARLEQRVKELNKEVARLRGARPSVFIAGSALRRGAETLRESFQRELASGRLRANPLTAARKTYARVRHELFNEPLLSELGIDWRELDKMTYLGEHRIELPGQRVLEPSSSTLVAHLLEYSMPHKQNGYTLRASNILRAQLAHGWQPLVITRPGFPEPGASGVETVDGIECHRLPGQGLGDRSRLSQHLSAYVREAAAVIDRARPALIHAASNFRNAYAAMELARGYGLPWVYEVRGLWEETRLADLGLDRNDVQYRRLVQVETYCMRRANAIVTLGTELASEIEQRGVAPEKIFLVPNGIDPEKIRPDALEPQTRSGFTVGYIGSITRLERLDVLVDAMALIGEREDIRALIVGDGTERELLEARARERGVADRIHFAGRVPHAEVAKSYAAVDAIACTRGRDRVSELVTPLKPLEAMGYRRPLIASDLPALRETIRDGETGRLVPPEDPAALARAITELADNPAQRDALATQAHRWVNSERTWTAVAANYQAAYEHAKASFRSR